MLALSGFGLQVLEAEASPEHRCAMRRTTRDSFRNAQDDRELLGAFVANMIAVFVRLRSQSKQVLFSAWLLPVPHPPRPSDKHINDWILRLCSGRQGWVDSREPHEQCGETAVILT